MKLPVKTLLFSYWLVTLQEIAPILWIPRFLKVTLSIRCDCLDVQKLMHFFCFQITIYCGHCSLDRSRTKWKDGIFIQQKVWGYIHCWWLNYTLGILSRSTSVPRCWCMQTLHELNKRNIRISNASWSYRRAYWLTYTYSCSCGLLLSSPSVGCIFQIYSQKIGNRPIIEVLHEIWIFGLCLQLPHASDHIHRL
jgi:hypothetical protein